MKTESWEGQGRAWWAVAVFCVVGTLSYTDRQILSLLVTPLRADLGISDVEVGLLQGLAFALIYSIAGIPLGRLTDKWSRRMILIIGVIVWTAATVACGFARSFGELFAARVLVGVGEAALAPAAISMIGDLFPPHRRGLAVSLFMMGLCVGAGVALGIGGALLRSAEEGAFNGLPVVGSLPPWRVVLVALAAPGAAVVALIATVHEPARRGTSAGGAQVASTLDAVRVLLRYRKVVVPMWGAMALLSVGDFSLLNWAPSLLERVHHESPDVVGFRLGVAAVLGGVAGTLLSGLVGDRLTLRHGGSVRARLAMLLALFACPAAAIGVGGGSPSLIIGCFVLWTAASWGAQSAGITAMQDILPNEVRGFNIAVMAFFNMIVGLAGGTAVTAALTEYIFRDPLSVGRSLSIVVAPSAVAAAILYHRSSRALGASWAAKLQPEEIHLTGEAPDPQGQDGR